MMRTRMDAWTLTKEEGVWPKTLDAYEKAVGMMRALDPPDDRPPVNPLGWRFQAAIHGIAKPGFPPTPDISNKLWCNCPHGSWFFFPWHRMYLAAFERIVRHFLDDDDWVLPYWYAIDPEDPGRGALPPAFLDTTRPGNNLHTDLRKPIVKAGQPIFGKLEPDGSNADFENCKDNLMTALGTVPFATDDGTNSFGSGKEDKPNFSGGEVGSLEDVPHGGVHVRVGRPGWMGSTYTAALDPVFWLHHANIDRLWEVWRSVDDAKHLNPDCPAWLETSFTFPAPENDTVTWTIGDVLDTRFLGYVYDSLAPAQLVQPVAPDAGPLREAVSVRSRGSAAAVREPSPPKVVGAAEDVPLTGAEPVTVQMSGPRPETAEAVGPRSASATAQAQGPEHAYLRLEGVRGTSAAAGYSVYLNVPQDEDPRDHPERRAGSLSTFRLEEASSRDELHDGGGLTTSYDITALRARLMAEGQWDDARVDVRFVSDGPAPLEDEDDAAEQEIADVRVRRIAILID